MADDPDQLVPGALGCLTFGDISKRHDYPDGLPGLVAHAIGPVLDREAGAVFAPAPLLTACERARGQERQIGANRLAHQVFGAPTAQHRGGRRIGKSDAPVEIESDDAVACSIDDLRGVRHGTAQHAHHGSSAQGFLVVS